MRQLVPHLWFDNEAEEAAKFYTGIFKNSKILSTVRYPKAAEEASGKRAGSVMTVEFEIEGQRFVALNGGPEFKFSEAISLRVPCKDQAEIDNYWSKLLAGGGEESVCGWLKDKYGLSWQVSPAILDKWFEEGDKERLNRVMEVVLKSVKLNLADIEAAYEGEPVGKR